MSWIQKLYETYDRCAGSPQFESTPLWPLSHTEQQAHIEIVVDENGNFQRAACVAKEKTIVPATEKSAGRTGTGGHPHPLCDKLQYCAADYKEFGGEKRSFFKKYIQQLREWHKFDRNPKVGAVLNYAEKGTIIADLVDARLLHCGPDRQLLTEWSPDAPTPELFKMLGQNEKKRDQGDAFVRWRVQMPGDPVSAIWEDPNIRESWIRYNSSPKADLGLCMVIGERTALAASHPKRIRNPADRAKLISSNDKSGYTFRGRFHNSNQVYSVGLTTTQKAHNALRWLIDRQGYQDEGSGQVFVAWAVSGKNIPDPLHDTAQIFQFAGLDQTAESAPYAGDAGQHFALRLKKVISGYGAELGDADEVVVIGLDSATKGRMAITFYRELTVAEFLDRVLNWHATYSWVQSYSKDLHFVGAPAPREIAEAAYGRRLDGALRKATVERLLPCIVDARPLPRDLAIASIRRVVNRAGMKAWDWEKCLGIACALVRGSGKDEKYQMSLEENRTTRDYLFGRLLAIAENIEQRALHLADETRDTHAAKLMQRFADHPSSTWRTIEISLAPSKTRLRANRGSLLVKREKLLDAVVGMFSHDDFMSDSKLSGEFLLGYHCQRAALWLKDKTQSETPGNTDSTIQGETA